MNDLIRRKDAIDAMRNSFCGNTYEVDKAIEAVETLPSVEIEQKWIPCSERLPEEEKQHYWVCTDTGYQCQCRWTNDVYGFGASDRWNWKIFDIPQYQEVVAWMPLPEPVII